MKTRTAAQFVEENMKTIFAYALSRVSHKEDAEDLANDIVLAILQSEDKLKNPEAFYGYVWGIATNTYRKFLNKRSRHQYEEMDEAVEDDRDFVEDITMKEELATLRREIALLSREHRECTIAYYFEELSCAEVSKKLDISLEMVKYYLFKTRKILKEGISMEREFGEKSFNPEKFEFVTVFSGSYNAEYRNLFARKLPGQILLSAYYTPMTIRELAVELGVASVYLEDELELLEKYNLVKLLPTGKVQTNLIIFTEDFTKEFYRDSTKFVVPAMTDILSGIKKKLTRIRSTCSFAGELSDSKILWGLLYLLMHQAYGVFQEKYAKYQEKSELYAGATGVNYGIAGSEPEELFSCGSFAGYAWLDESFYVTGADFGVLDKKNFYFCDLDRQSLAEQLHQSMEGLSKPDLFLMKLEEEASLFALLKEEIQELSKVYERLLQFSCELMKMHAPKSMEEQAERIVFQTIFFRTVGLFGGCAVKCGELSLPDFGGPAAICVRENTKEAAAGVSSNVAIK